MNNDQNDQALKFGGPKLDQSPHGLGKIKKSPGPNIGWVQVPTRVRQQRSRPMGEQRKRRKDKGDTALQAKETPKPEGWCGGLRVTEEGSVLCRSREFEAQLGSVAYQNTPASLGVSYEQPFCFYFCTRNARYLFILSNCFFHSLNDIWTPLLHKTQYLMC